LRPGQAGYELFRGKAQCNDSHRDGGPGKFAQILNADVADGSMNEPARAGSRYARAGQMARSALTN
jgi:hypothetical protein